MGRQKKVTSSTRKNRELAALRRELANTLAELVLTRTQLEYYIRRFGPRDKSTYRCVGSLLYGCENKVPTTGVYCSPCQEEVDKADTPDEGDDDDVGNIMVALERKPPGGGGSSSSSAIPVS
jgi:hypothetical protein